MYRLSDVQAKSASSSTGTTGCHYRTWAPQVFLPPAPDERLMKSALKKDKKSLSTAARLGQDLGNEKVPS